MTELRTCIYCCLDKYIYEFCTYKYKGKTKYQNGCRECAKNRNADWYRRNKEKHAVYRDEYYKSNSSKIKMQKKIYRKENRESVEKYNAKWRELNRERKSEYDSKWRRANPEKRAEYESRRKSVKLNSTPPWLTEEQNLLMVETYAHARDCYLVTGEKYHVDHIIPLQGKDVCGLHVPWNLQVLPADVNISKGNKLVVDTQWKMCEKTGRSLGG